MMDDLDLLERLSEAFGVSDLEEEVRREIRQIVEDLSDEERKQPLKVEELVIDIGMASEDEILDAGVCPGIPGTIHHPFRQIQKGVVVGKAFDDRAGCALLVRALEAFSTKRPDFTVVANFAVGEELGLRGARTAAARIEPHLALIVEGTIAADIPGVVRTKQPTQLGRGPAITVADRSIVVNPTLVAFIEEAATECKIPWQTKMPLFGATALISITKPISRSECPAFRGSRPGRPTKMSVSVCVRPRFNDLNRCKGQLLLHSW